MWPLRLLTPLRAAALLAVAVTAMAVHYAGPQREGWGLDSEGGYAAYFSAAVLLAAGALAVLAGRSRPSGRLPFYGLGALLLWLAAPAALLAGGAAWWTSQLLELLQWGGEGDVLVLPSTIYYEELLEVAGSGLIAVAMLAVLHAAAGASRAGLAAGRSVPHAH